MFRLHYMPILLLITILVGCAAIGTKTLYKSDSKHEIRRIGFTKLDGDSIVSRIFPQTDSIFRNTYQETLKSYKLSDSNIITLPKEFSITNPNTSLIANICRELNIDGLVISKLKFINVTHTAYFVPYAANYDTEVDMKIFNRNGVLVLSVRHNTQKGNSYLNLPTPDMTIRDGTKGALKRIAKEFEWSK